jgi:membrane protease YdiL (CAAX protease family)
MKRGRWHAARPWVYSSLVVLAGNAKVVLGNRSMAGDRRGVLTGLSLSVVSLIYARRVADLSWEALGLLPARSIPRSVGVGLLVVSAPTLIAAIGARALRRMGISAEPMQPPGDLAQISVDALRRRVLRYLWFDTALPEELLLRSILLAELRPRFRGPVWPTMLSMACFLAWHACLGWSEVPDHNPRVLSAKFGSYALGSLMFTAPYLATGHVAGSILAHWLTDCLLLVVGHPSGARLKAIVLSD